MERQFQAEETAVTPNVETPTAVASLDNKTEVVPQDEAVVQALIEKARQKVQSRKRRFYISLAAMIGLSIALCPVLAVFLLPPKYAGMLIGQLIMYSIATGALLLLVRDIRKPFPFDIEGLTRLSGIRAIVPLIDALSIPRNTEQDKALIAALTALLLQLKASDAHLLTSPQRQLLYKTLTREAETVPRSEEGLEFKLAILKALEQVGDRKFLPVVQRLANLKCRSERQRKIREAAEACLPYLRERIGQAPMQQTLLRPSSAEHATPDTLLRPAVPGPETPAEQLLRPTEDA